MGQSSSDAGVRCQKSSADDRTSCPATRMTASCISASRTGRPPDSSLRMRQDEQMRLHQQHASETQGSVSAEPVEDSEEKALGFTSPCFSSGRLLAMPCRRFGRLFFGTSFCGAWPPDPHLLVWGFFSGEILDRRGDALLHLLHPARCAELGASTPIARWQTDSSKGSPMGPCYGPL